MLKIFIDLMHLQVDYLVMLIKVQLAVQVIFMEHLVYLKGFTINSILPEQLIMILYILRKHYNNSLQILCGQ